MNIRIAGGEGSGTAVAVVEADQVLIEDVQSALDLMATVQYDTGSSRIVMDRSLFSEAFFDLSTRLAGEVLQKFINYQVKLAIVGDFSVVKSSSLRDFIYECNHGKDFFFLPTEEEAIGRLSSV